MNKRRRRCDCTKLTITDITKINTLYDEGEKPKDIASQFCIGLTRLYKILRGEEKEGGHHTTKQKKPTEVTTTDTSLDKIREECLDTMRQLKERTEKRKGRLLSSFRSFA